VASSAAHHFGSSKIASYTKNPALPKCNQLTGICTQRERSKSQSSPRKVWSCSRLLGGGECLSRISVFTHCLMKASESLNCGATPTMRVRYGSCYKNSTWSVTKQLSPLFAWLRTCLEEVLVYDEDLSLRRPIVPGMMMMRTSVSPWTKIKGNLIPRTKMTMMILRTQDPYA
jgi:hypothetical protein